MTVGDPGRVNAVAAEYRGALDDALVRAATAAGVGLVQVGIDGSVWWSDEAYRLHGRPRWMRVRSLEDLAWGLTPATAAQVRRTYAACLHDPDLELRYTAQGEHGPARDLVLHAIDRGVALVHGATPPARSAGAGFVIDVRDRATDVVTPHEPADEVTAPGLEVEVEVPGVEAHDVEAHGVVVEGVGEALVESADVVGGETAGPPAPPEGAAPAGEPEPAAAPDEHAVGGVRPEDQHEVLASALLDSTPDLVLRCGLRPRRVIATTGDEHHHALAGQLRAGRTIGELVHPDDETRFARWRDGLAALTPGAVHDVEVRLRADDGWRWCRLYASELRRENDVVEEVLVVVRDVHQRVEAGRRSLETERAFRDVFDASPVGLAVLDPQGRFADVNDAFCVLAGRTREAVTSTVFEALLHPEDRTPALIARARAQGPGAAPAPSERRLVRADGSTIWVRMRTSEIEYDGTRHTLVSLEDVTSAKATEEQLRHDALHDELTGLPNRRLLLDRLERALTRSRRHDTRLAVYFIDLDDLKRVNDTHPWQHRAGDILLTSTASAVRETLREADTLGRLGGDEFVAICEDVGDDSAIADLGERILQAVRSPLTIGGETLVTSASIGVAVTADDHESAEEVLRRADAAMYAAKAGGGSRVEVSGAESADTARPDLLSALARRELRLHYQPVVSLGAGAVLGVNAVLRWRHPERGMLPPAAVREALEGGASSLPVVYWALERAVSDVRTVAPTRVEHVSVWLPVPGRAALATSTLDAVTEAIAGPDGTGTVDSAPSLVLDVHEDEVSGLMRRRGVHQQLDSLLARGPLALGVQSFTADAIPVGTLQLLSVASVSLDPELLLAAAENSATEELVRALVSAASAVGVITIASDVESQEQLDVARALGVHAAYGDLIGPPAPLDTYSDLLHGGRMTLPEPARPEQPSGPEGLGGEGIAGTAHIIAEPVAPESPGDTSAAPRTTTPRPAPRPVPRTSLRREELPSDEPVPVEPGRPAPGPVAPVPAEPVSSGPAEPPVRHAAPASDVVTSDVTEPAAASAAAAGSPSPTDQAGLQGAMAATSPQRADEAGGQVGTGPLAAVGAAQPSDGASSGAAAQQAEGDIAEQVAAELGVELPPSPPDIRLSRARVVPTVSDDERAAEDAMTPTGLDDEPGSPAARPERPEVVLPPAPPILLRPTRD